MRKSELRSFLENQYARYHRPEFLCMDPLVCLQRFTVPRDIEIAGLVASGLSYGRVETIIKSVNTIFDSTGDSIADFSANTTLAQKMRVFKNFRHRFNDGGDIAHLLHGAGSVCKAHGSLEALFSGGISAGDRSVKDALSLFVNSLKTAVFPRPDRHAAKGLDYLLPSPASGSACKRLNMYLRWMVRKNDGIDRGVWTGVPASLLVMPLDTHVARIAGSLGLTKRKCVDWTMAEEITARLRECDPGDPVRFDFSLCRTGMVDFRRKAA
jgi:uncharacterized protein (TIGR02757 family)